MARLETGVLQPKNLALWARLDPKLNLKALLPMPPTPTLTPSLDLTWLGCAKWGLDNVGVSLAGFFVDWA